MVIGENNIVQAKGHLAWKWNGTRFQRTGLNQRTAGQTVDGILVPRQLTAQNENEEETEMLNTGNLTTVTLKGTGCAVLAGTFPVSGSEVIIPNREAEEWGKSLSVRTIPSPSTGQFLQHAWVNGRPRGYEILPLFAGNTASIIGQTTLESEQQEIATFEK